MTGPRATKGKALSAASGSSSDETLALVEVMSAILPGADTRTRLRAREPSPCPDAFEQALRQPAQFPLPFGQIHQPAANGLSPPPLDAGGVPLAAVACTSELKQRPARAPDYESENRALVALAQALADSPATILETLAESILEVLKVGSAGISLLAKDGQTFVWPAIAGLWRAHVGGGTPRHFGPCGDVLDCKAPMLFRQMELRYTYLLGVTPRIEEALLVPFFNQGKAVGTIWALAHDEQRRFDAEDLRQLESLSRFAAGAYSSVECVNNALCLIEEKRKSHAEVDKIGAELQQNALLYSALFESIDEGFCIIEKIANTSGKALDFRYIQANPACELQGGFGYLPGKTIRQLIPDECDEWLRTYDTVLRTGKAQKFERRLVSTGRVLELHAFRIEDETQRRVGVSFRDVTERKAAEDALRHRTAQFETLLNEAPLGVYLVDADFRICQANPIARATFKLLPDLIGLDFADAARLLYPATTADKVVRHFRHTLDTGEPWEVAQWEERRNDNQPSASFEWQINRIALPDGGYGVVCYFRNISQRVQGEQHLRAAEERYRHLFNSMDEGYCIIELIFDPQNKPVDYRFLEVNPAFSKQNGMHDVVGKRVRELNPDLEEHWFETYGKVALTGEAIRFVNESKSMGGRWFDLYAFRVGDEHSRKVAVLFRNVKERQEAEQALRESEERYRNLFNSMDEGFCIIEMIFDAQQKVVDYRFLEVNPAFEKHSGMQGVVGRRVREIIPAPVEHLFEIYGKVALTGMAVRLVSEVKRLHGWLDIYAARLGEARNSRVAVMFSNITERIKIEEALRSSEQRFRALFDRGPLAMYTVDAAGTVQECNQEAVALWGREPARGDPGEKFYDVFRVCLSDGSVLPYEKTSMAAVLKGEIPFAQDVKVIIERPDGSRIDVVANIVPLLSAEGKIIGAINCFYDVTERSLLERRSHEQAEMLADQHRRKDEFLAMLSHELRSPLAPIANSLQLLRLQKNEEPIQRQARQVIERQVGQLKHLVDDLLEVARISSGRVQLRREEIDARGIVESAVETTRPLIAQKRHALEVSLPTQPVWLHADGSRLEQVVINLLTNAAKYTDEDGRIFLGVAAEGDEAVIRVRDNGIGIAAELLPQVFDLFTQADRSLDRSEGGLGIGLSLVRQLVDLHAGTVTASSSVGKGSEFTVRLPLSKTLAPQPPEPFADTQGQSGSGCRVLVVDDNVDSARSLADLLELEGHETRMAHDGAGALNAALTWRPDVALLDIGLPGLNGFEVATQIRQDPALVSMVLVALTGYGQEADRRHSQEAGFDYHLVKPADFDEIQKILSMVAYKAS